MAKLLNILKNTNNIHNSSIRSDKGLTRERSAFQIVHGGNSTLLYYNTVNPIKIYLSDIQR